MWVGSELTPLCASANEESGPLARATYRYLSNLCDAHTLDTFMQQTLSDRLISSGHGGDGAGDGGGRRQGRAGAGAGAGQDRPGHVFFFFSFSLFLFFSFSLFLFFSFSLFLFFSFSSFSLFLFFSFSLFLSYHKLGTLTYYTLSKVMICYDKRVAVLPKNFSFSFFSQCWPFLEFCVDFGGGQQET